VGAKRDATAANAGRQEDKIKCLANSDKAFWIESKGACIPLNPCGNSRFSAYCVRAFANIQVGNASQAIQLAEKYAEYNEGINCKVVNAPKSKLTGQDFIVCIGEDDYLQFEFDDVSETDNTVAELGYQEGLCIAYGGSPANNWRSTRLCRNVHSYLCSELGGEQVGDAGCKLGTASGNGRRVPSIYTTGD
jgi:hypothetical protein